MLRPLLSLLNRKSYPLNKILIYKDQLIKNYNHLSLINSKIKIAPVLKSNAYGHGILEIGKIIDKLNPPIICVDSLYEANLLRKSGVKSEILIMGYIDPESLKRRKLNFHFAIWDLESANTLNEFQPNAKVHIFVDTGMRREGILLSDLPEFLDKFKEFKNIEIEGLMSHLAMADKPEDSLTKLQIKNFKNAQKIFKNKKIKVKWTHLGGGVANLTINTDCNLIRTGKILYGVGPELDKTDLKPILKLTTKLAQIKKIRKGDRVGYDGTFTANKDITIGVLPIGYNDGVDRRLSSKGFVTVKNISCPIIGRISMNITTINLNGLSVSIGEEVVVYSDNPNDINSIQHQANIAETIPYDLMVNLVPSTRREVI